MQPPGLNSAPERYYSPVTTRVPEFEVLEMGTPFLIRWKNPPDFTDDELLEFIELNDDAFQVERDCDGSLLLESGVTLPTNRHETEVVVQLRNWASKDGTGEGLGPTGRWVFPDGRTTRAPDALWISNERVATLSREAMRHLPHLVPEFVIEVRSESQRLRRLQAKMEEWIANGVRLGWLLDEQHKTAYVYRPGTEVQVVVRATSIDASPELPGFVLDLEPIWK